MLLSRNAAISAVMQRGAHQRNSLGSPRCIEGRQQCGANADVHTGERLAVVVERHDHVVNLGGPKTLGIS